MTTRELYVKVNLRVELVGGGMTVVVIRAVSRAHPYQLRGGERCSDRERIDRDIYERPYCAVILITDTYAEFGVSVV